jgi:hypothetical protein
LNKYTELLHLLKERTQKYDTAIDSLLCKKCCDKIYGFIFMYSQKHARKKNNCLLVKKKTQLYNISLDYDGPMIDFGSKYFTF